MNYDFDKIIDRRGTSTYKYEFCNYYFGTDDVLPLWVADMDFETPDFIMYPLLERMKHPVMGYTIPQKDLNASIINWIGRQHNWTLSDKWLKFMPGVLPSIAAALQVFSKKGDKVMIQTPVYPPFISIPKAAGRKVTYNKLKREGNRYKMDIEAFKSQITENTSVFILCNPHNPAGVVWTKDELKQIAEICYDNNILVISDEIHADLVHPGKKHIPFVSVSRKARENSITLMAPSKTFNIAGLGNSFCVVPNSKIRNTYYRYLNSLHISHSNMFAYLATMAAFNHGDDWLRQLKDYLKGNFEYSNDYILKNMPLAEAFETDASFLLWIDFNKMGLDPVKLKQLMVQKGKIGMNNGADFGPGGEGFQRLNLGAPRSVILEALKRIEKAVNN